MKPFFLSLLIVPALGLVSCETLTLDEIDSAAQGDEWVAPADKELGFVDINESWRLKGEGLDVVRDDSTGRRVLTATAQGHTELTSLRPPRQTRVDTVTT